MTDQTVPTDEDLARIIINADVRLDCLFGDDEGIDEHALKAARAVRAALAAPVPPVQIPEGWHLSSIEPGLHEGELQFQATIIQDQPGDEVISGWHPTDPWQALASASTAAREVGKQ